MSSNVLEARRFIAHLRFVGFRFLPMAFIRHFKPSSSEYYHEDDGGTSSFPIYWGIFATVVINSLYPSVLLGMRDAFMSRTVVSGMDAALDVVYSMVFWFVMFLNGAFAAAFPTAPLDVLSLFYPTAHVLFGTGLSSLDPSWFLAPLSPRSLTTTRSSLPRDRGGGCGPAGARAPRPERWAHDRISL